jgi:hypothetical protein
VHLPHIGFAAGQVSLLFGGRGLEMRRTCPHCGVELPELSDAFCCACHSPLDEPTEERVQLLPRSQRIAPPAEPASENNPRAASPAPWLPWVWIGGGVYILVRNGWPPRFPLFAAGACIAIGIGIGLWFMERYDLFRPWRLVIHNVLLGVVLAALAATIVWDVGRHAGR